VPSQSSASSGAAAAIAASSGKQAQSVAVEMRTWLAPLLLIASQASTSEVQARNAAVALHRHLADTKPDGMNVTFSAAKSLSSDRAASSAGTNSHLQLLRRESAALTKTSEEEHESGTHRDYYKFMKAVSAGDVSAFCVDNDIIYAVAVETLYNSLLHGGIYKQGFFEMTPSTNWTLIGYGAMKSIAVRRGVMYGVGTITRQLFQQRLADMHNENVWHMKSTRKLVTISILEDTIYAVSEDDGQLYKQDFPWEDDIERGWELISECPGKIASFSTTAGPAVYAIFDNDKVYYKELNQNQPQLAWRLKGEASFSAINVQGDSLYAVGGDQRIYRQPLRINFRWSRAFSEDWQSVTIRGNQIYGLDLKGRIWSQFLREEATAKWKALSGPGSSRPAVKQILIQGAYIYGVSGDLVYKEMMRNLTARWPPQWVQASKCCAKSIAAADGLIYGIGVDDKLYVQVDTLMTIHSEWTLIASGPVKSITFRGDTIYGVQGSGHVYEQRMSTLTPTSAWMEGEMLEDVMEPSGKYLMILVHGDTMYAVGEDKAIYSKMLQSNITWPVGTHQHEHDTRLQALAHNLTDLTTTTPREVSSTEAWQQSTTLKLNTTTVSLIRAQTTAGFFVSTSSSHEVGLQARYTDYFNSPTGIKEEQETGQVLPPPYRPPDSDFPGLESHGTTCSPGTHSWLLLWLVIFSCAFTDVQPCTSEGSKGLCKR